MMSPSTSVVSIVSDPENKSGDVVRVIQVRLALRSLLVEWDGMSGVDEVEERGRERKK